MWPSAMLVLPTGLGYAVAWACTAEVDLIASWASYTVWWVMAVGFSYTSRASRAADHGPYIFHLWSQFKYTTLHWRVKYILIQPINDSFNNRLEK